MFSLRTMLRTVRKVSSIDAGEGTFHMGFQALPEFDLHDRLLAPWCPFVLFFVVSGGRV